MVSPKKLLPIGSLGKIDGCVELVTSAVEWSSNKNEKKRKEGSGNEKDSRIALGKGPYYLLRYESAQIELYKQMAFADMINDNTPLSNDDCQNNIFKSVQMLCKNLKHI